jgi:hypothetical protein
MQDLLPKGTPAQVRGEVRRYCETLGAGGGYILAPAHLFQPDVPPENVLAVYGQSDVTLLMKGRQRSTWPASGHNPTDEPEIQLNPV